MATFTEEQRKGLAAKGQALPDGSFPIRNKADLSNAIHAAGRAKNEASAKAHIIKRAKALGATDLLPDGWVTQESEMPEEKKPLELLLRLEEVGAAQLIQEANGENSEVMKIKVPFYVGNSIASAPGFANKIYFPTSLLPGILQEGKDQIAAGKQPMNVYARHAQAMSGDHLPIGVISDLEQEGDRGWATIDIAPTSQGKDAQVLVKHGMLNAISLRSNPDRYKMEKRKVNGEVMLECINLAIDGVDFAPDSPAQDTYGVQILAAEARVEPAVDEPTKNSLRSKKRMTDPLTLEDIKTSSPEVLEEIEAPLKAELKRVTAERDALVQEKDRLERDEAIVALSKHFPNPEEVFPIIQEHCKEAKTKADVERLTGPIAIELLKRQAENPIPQKSTAELLAEKFFPTPSAGETKQEEKEETPEPALVQETRGRQTTVGGLLIPE